MADNSQVSFGLSSIHPFRENYGYPLRLLETQILKIWKKLQ